MSGSKDYELWCGLVDEGRAEKPEYYLNGKFLYVEPGTRIGPKDHKFEIMAKLGHGGTSVVWLAQGRKKNTGSREWCAIKILAAGKGSVDGEIAAVERVKSCGLEVVGCEKKSDAWTEERNGRKYLCLKMNLSGPSLTECLGRKLTPELRLSFAIQATDIMSKLHQKNVFLYDFTASNLLVKLKPNIKDKLMMDIIEETMDSEEVVVKSDRKATTLNVSKDPKFPKFLYAPNSLRELIDDRLPLQLIDVYESKFVQLRTWWHLHSSISLYLVVKYLQLIIHPDPSKPGCSHPYAPPEFLEKIDQGGEPIIPDAKSNIFSLGVLICKILSGHYPFEDRFREVQAAQNEFYGISPVTAPLRYSNSVRWAAKKLGDESAVSERESLVNDLLYTIFHVHKHPTKHVPLDWISGMLEQIKEGKGRLTRTDSAIADDFSSLDINSRKASKTSPSNTTKSSSSRRKSPQRSANTANATTSLPKSTRQTPPVPKSDSRGPTNPPVKVKDKKATPTKERRRSRSHTPPPPSRRSNGIVS
ncbi:hypothetical protein CJF32_00008213 [Rutstroemia sp. NJR-2017a WRK4]|nr:hypothetical protein CJF32_00008213 [Rutstroemia sp. NJR-2017a WRK4]